MDFLNTIGIGAAIGVLVGLTGTGSGSLLTPLLILVARMTPVTAVGTSLVFSVVTRFYGGWTFYRRGLVRMEIVRDLWIGGVPGALLGGLLIHYLGVRRPEALNLLTVRCIGIALILGALLIMVRVVPWDWRPEVIRRKELPFSASRRRLLMASAGFVTGLSLSITSIGSGTLLIPAMILLARFPPGTPGTLAGTTVSAGTILSFVAALPYASLGNVHWESVAALLCGSIPALWLSTRAHGWLPRQIPEGILAAALMIAGLRILSS